MIKEDKTVVDIVERIYEIDCHIQIVIDKIKNQTSSLNSKDWITYKSIIQWSNDVINDLKERDGLMFALGHLDEEKYEEMKENVKCRKIQRRAKRKW